jgi:NADPH:quinone reductase-like Zn-dependent oxidoreductase
MTLPERMCAVVLTGHGGLDRLEYRTDVPVPRPDAGEVLIRVGACGMNNTDINTRIGWYSPSVRTGTTAEAGGEGLEDVIAEASTWGRSSISFPRIQGADVAGRIVAVGDGVHAERIGERVLVDPWIRDPKVPRNLDRVIFLGSERDGGFAEFVCLPGRNAHPFDGGLTDAELATYPCAYLTAENMLERVRLARGEAVLITGASGGVGSALVQLAKRRGATIVAVAGASKRDRVWEIGADAVIAREADDLVAEVAKAMGGQALDVVADVVGGPAFPAYLAVLKRGGRYVTSGAIAGPIAELDLRTLYLKDLELIGATITSPETFGNLIRYIEAREVRPLLAATFEFKDIRAAQEEFLKKKFVGNLVLVPPEG